MTKISLELDAKLNKRLKQYALDKYDSSFGHQQTIIRDALIAYLDAHEKMRLPMIPKEVVVAQESIVAAEIDNIPTPPPARKKTKITKKPPIKSNPKALAIIKERSQTGTIQEIVDEIFNRTGYDYSNNTVKKHIAKIKNNE